MFAACLLLIERVVFLHGAGNVAVKYLLPVPKQECTIAKSAYRGHIVGDKYQARTLANELLHLVKAALLEMVVTDAQNLVHYQHIGIYMSSHGEAQSGIHTGRVSLNWSVKVVA